MKTNQERFLEAANWALLHEKQNDDVGINIRRMNVDGRRNVTIFNGSKTLMYSGYAHNEQEQLKGLIVEEYDSTAIRVLAGCFPKFYNLGEPSEKKSYCKFIKRDGVDVHFYIKEDGTNIRPYWNAASNQVEFATRSMLTGFTDEDFNFNFGDAARQIATEKYPILLNKDFVEQYSLIFELIHPDSRIITNYGNTKDLILLAGFNLNKNCNELTRIELETMSLEHKFNLVGIYARIPNSKFDETLDTLSSMWAGTDKEGTVATFVRSEDGEPLYRLKIKNKEYLDMLRLSRYCTLKRTRELIETQGIKTWEELRAKLYENVSMNEEIEMAYKDHWITYKGWLSEIDEFVSGWIIMYESLPAYESQKEFALAIMGNPIYKLYSGAFFEIRKIELAKQKWWESDKLRIMAEKFVPLGVDEEEEPAI